MIAYHTDPYLTRSDLDSLTETDGVWVDRSWPEDSMWRGTSEYSYALTDGTNYFLATIGAADNVTSYWLYDYGNPDADYGTNDATRIISILESLFGVRFISEHDDEFWN